MKFDPRTLRCCIYWLLCGCLVLAGGPLTAAEPPEGEQAPPVEDAVPAGGDTPEAPAENDEQPGEQAPDADDDSDGEEEPRKDDAPLREIEPDEQAAASEEDTPEPESAYEELELLAQALLHIRKSYVNEKSYRELVYGALHGMLHSLDPHSAFLEPKEYDDMQEGTKAQFSGIGIHIGMRKGILTVIAPIEDTPAFRAGLMAGDRIVEIEGEKTQGISMQDAVDRLRGPQGEPVTITIFRPGDEEGTREVTIVRDTIEVPSVKGSRIVRDGIGYVRVTTFAQPTADDLQEKLDELLAQDMRALVIDLRNNPGGLLKTAILVAQKFLKKGQVIVTTQGREGVYDELVSTAQGSVHLTDVPLAILVNEGSASASEIVAGALQDHHRAVLVGSKTFGKGSVQSVIRMKPDGKSAVRITTAHYHTPGGRMIHGKGIEPDISVSLTPQQWRRVQMRRAHLESPELFSDEDKAEFADAVDEPLERAVDLLHAVLIFRQAE